MLLYVFTDFLHPDVICKKCKAVQRNCLMLLPCRHVGLCTNCAMAAFTTIGLCPSCNRVVEGVVKYYQ